MQFHLSQLCLSLWGNEVTWYRQSFNEITNYILLQRLVFISFHVKFTQTNSNWSKFFFLYLVIYLLCFVLLRRWVTMALPNFLFLVAFSNVCLYYPSKSLVLPSIYIGWSGRLLRQLRRKQNLTQKKNLFSVLSVEKECVDFQQSFPTNHNLS